MVVDSMMCYQLDIWLVEFRERFHVTHEEIIMLAGLSRATYYRIQSGCQVSERTRCKLLNAYAVLLAREAC